MTEDWTLVQHQKTTCSAPKASFSQCKRRSLLKSVEPTVTQKKDGIFRNVCVEALQGKSFREGSLSPVSPEFGLFLLFWNNSSK